MFQIRQLGAPGLAGQSHCLASCFRPASVSPDATSASPRKPRSSTICASLSPAGSRPAPRVWTMALSVPAPGFAEGVGNNADDRFAVLRDGKTFAEHPLKVSCRSRSPNIAAKSTLTAKCELLNSLVARFVREHRRAFEPKLRLGKVGEQVVCCRIERQPRDSRSPKPPDRFGFADGLESALHSGGRILPT